MNSVLNKALASANGIVGDNTTDQFSHVATGSDKLTNLRTKDGTDIGLDLLDTIPGRVGGVEIDSVQGGDADALK